MENRQSIFTKYEFPLFFFLAYALSWWSFPLLGGAIMPHGPAFAALIVLALTAGKKGLADWWRRLSRWRVAWHWYLIGPGIIAGYQTAAFALNLLLGASIAAFPSIPAAGTFLQLLLVGGQWEEPGWTGYALPKLQERFANRPNSSLVAALVLGVFRAIWHLPLFLNGKVAWFDIFIFSFAIQIIITWLYNRTGSVPVVMVFHFVSNIFGAIQSPVFTGIDATNYYALFVALGCVVALVIVWRTKLTLGKTDAQPI